MTYAFDPELTGVVAMMPNNDLTDLSGARKRMKAALTEMFGETDTRGVTVRDELVAGPDGAPDIPLRVYLPNRQAGAAAILDVHGGAYTTGDLDTNHVNNLGLARDLGVVVVAVDYRLAPEAPFPAGLDDCYAALCWMAAHTGELGVDPSRIAIRGESAGGWALRRACAAGQGPRWTSYRLPVPCYSAARRQVGDSQYARRSINRPLARNQPVSISCRRPRRGGRPRTSNPIRVRTAAT
ncbi:MULTISPECIES: alpha/beta hydrolase [Nocardia]|uniref:alpha/beta hydrolase n=1 Tax=Nocardia TaxID=1817 RepID=UPI002E2EFD44|nr:alpha/beta hydrolase [Nocardia vinacea]